jgi:hypothetical protein
MVKMVVVSGKYGGEPGHLGSWALQGMQGAFGTDRSSDECLKRDAESELGEIGDYVQRTGRD